MYKNSLFPKRDVLLIIGILLIATNLRAPFTSMSPLLNIIREYYKLTATQAGILQTIPLLAFAVLSPFAAGLAHKVSIEKALFFSLLTIAAGVYMRSFAGIGGLYAGTLMLGSGIAIGNVLLPSILKRDLPHKAASLTGFYALMMGLAAALGSAIVIPVMESLHTTWQNTLLFTLVFPLVSLIVWIPQLTTHKNINLDHQCSEQTQYKSNIWRSWLAWQVSLYFGINAFIYYIVVAWLPSILQSFGFSVAEAGSLHAVLQLSTAVPGIFIGPVLIRLRDQKVLSVVFALLGTFGLVGLLTKPSLATAWIVLIGISTGAGVILGLAFISLRARNSNQAASLSGMAQCLGYMLAAFGPPLAGLIHDKADSWTLPVISCACLTCVLSVLGYMTGRARQLPA